MGSKNLPKVIGTDDYIQLSNGRKARVILLNNAATTPPFEITLQAVNDFLQTYSATHRGAGPHANQTLRRVEAALETIREFLDAKRDHALLFTQNTSVAINLFARLLRLTPDDVIVTSAIEHTSNNLPWRLSTPAKVMHANAFDDGSLDYDDLRDKLGQHPGKIKLVAITGASNLTGCVTDIPKVAKLAHDHGALLFVDAAQLAPHRKIDMDRDGIDALAFSAHKMYAPFGLGILVLPQSLLDNAPVDPGGGSIDMISESGDLVWAPAPARHQTGTWNVTGVIALAASCKAMMEAGWNNITAHEAELVRYAAKRLPEVSNIVLYIPPDKYVNEDRIGTFPFNLNGYHHALLSAVLEHEYGIETRSGTICNHRLVRRWFKVSDRHQEQIEVEILGGNRLASYGVVRASLGIHNTKADIDALVQALKEIAAKGHRLKYKALPSEEAYACDDESSD